jgi:hypothetical protein
VLREAEFGDTVAEICCKHGHQPADVLYLWKKKYAGLGVSELRDLRRRDGLWSHSAECRTIMLIARLAWTCSARGMSQKASAKLAQVPSGWSQAIDLSVDISGGRGRDRTYDQSIKSRMLYQLSYASTVLGTLMR